MSTLVAKFTSTDRETGTEHFIEVYDQPFRDALVARLFRTVARVVEPVAMRLDPVWVRVTHRNGCPNPQPLTRVADGALTDPMCICLPLCARLDYQGYRLAHHNRVRLSNIAVDEVVYEAVGGSPWLLT